MMISTHRPRRLTFRCFDTPKQAARWMNTGDNLARIYSVVQHHGKTIVNHYV